jgi:hypothetical protein
MEKVFLLKNLLSADYMKYNDLTNHIKCGADLLQRIGCIESENILPVSGYDSFSDDAKMSYLCMPVEGMNDTFFLLCSPTPGLITSLYFFIFIAPYPRIKSLQNHREERFHYSPKIAVCKWETKSVL